MEECDQLGILSKAATQADIIAGYLQEEGDAALMLEVHEQAAQALDTLTKGTPVSDDDLLSSVVSVARSIMTALESSSQKADNYFLLDTIREDHENPANKAKYMREANELFTQATPIFLTNVLFSIENVKHACKSPGAANPDSSTC